LSGYQLIDFGDGRKLESLDGYIVDRPSPAASAFSKTCDRRRWLAADARFDSDRKDWQFHQPWPAAIALDAGDFRLPFRATPFGHIGCFPEQLPNWQWLAKTLAELGGKHLVAGDWASKPLLQCLNLFAHTGGSTLAMACQGAIVTHVDAAKPSVNIARQTAQDNRLNEATIRYLVEDASRYVGRELRRGRKYDVIVLDPPGYGHAAGGKTWRIQRDLWPLLDDCLRLLPTGGAAMLITGHSQVPDQNEIASYLRQRLGTRGPTADGNAAADRLSIETGRSQLTDLAGRHLDMGYYVRACW
jgi:23S rRNA (cytosine1962-C5)-methyltransferase